MRPVIWPCGPSRSRRRSRCATALRRPCRGRVQPLGEVAGRAQRVLVQVVADALLDVVLVQSRGGAAVAGATRGRSTRRTLRHHRRRDERRRWRRWGGCFVHGAMRLHCRDLPTLVKGVAREEEGTRPRRVNQPARPRGSRSWPRVPLLGAVALRWLSAPRLKSCPQGQPPPILVPSGSTATEAPAAAEFSPKAQGASDCGHACALAYSARLRRGCPSAPRRASSSRSAPPLRAAGARGSPYVPPAVCGSIVWASALPPTCTRRGLAVSATGIVSVSTPCSQLACRCSESSVSPRKIWRV